MPKTQTQDAAKAEPIEAVLDIESLVNDPLNARTHDEDNITTIIQSLTTFDQVHPIVVRKEGSVVIAGNGRLEAMRRLGWSRCKALVVDWDDARCKAFSLIDNRSAEQAGWDYKRLADVASELESTPYTMGSLGFDDDFMGPVLSGEVFAETPDAAESVERIKHGKPVQLTPEQRQIFDQACARLRENEKQDYSEGRCLELMSAQYLAGA